MNYANLIQNITENIKTNGSQAITAQVLQDVLVDMVGELGQSGALLGGVIDTSFVPDLTNDAQVVYIAESPGTYTNFNGLVVGAGEVAFFYFDGNAWAKSSVDVLEVVNDLSSTATDKALSAAMGKQIGDNISQLRQEVNLLDDVVFGTNTAKTMVWQRVGYYLSTTGSLQQSASWSISSPLMLKKGLRVIVKTQGSGACVIAETADGQTYTPLVNIPSGVSGLNEYSYIASENKQVAISAKVGLNDVEVKIYAEGIGDIQQKLETNYLDKRPGINILNLEGIGAGGLDSTGSADFNTSFSHTDFIPIKASTQYICTKSDNDSFGGGSYKHCLYDKSFNLIDSIASSSTTFTTAATAAYAKFTIRNTSIALQPMVNEGPSRSAQYSPYDPIFGYTGEIRAGLKEIKQGYVPTALSKNLLDISSVTVGYLYGDGNENNTNNTYRKSGYISVSPGNYYLSAVSHVVQGSTTPIFAFYDSEKTYVGKQQWVSSELTGILITVPSGASFVRLTLYADSITDSLQFEAGTQRTKYEPYSLIFGYTKEMQNELSALTPAKNGVGKQGLSASIATLSNGALSLSGFPQYIKSNGVVSGGGKITQFNQVVVGYGYGSAMGKYVKVDGTDITLCSTSSAGAERTIETVAHNLTISEFIDVVLFINGYKVTAIVSTLGGYKTIAHTYNDTDSANGLVESMSGTPSIVADSNTTLTAVTLRTTSDSFRLPVWVFGDSYTSQNTERWPFYARYQFGINALWIGLSGGQSSQLFSDLEKALSFGCPKFLVWCLGMNDSYANYQSYFARVKDICVQNGIEMILGTVPLVPLSGYADKNWQINNYIKASGLRYIDFAAAVGADTSSTWYNGCLSSDDIHPTVKGAKCLFAGAFKDFPEFIQYGMRSL